MTLACVTGRFQPVHDQHVELFGIALAECDRLVVAVTNPDPGARHEEPTSAHRHTATANPFTYYERLRLLDAALAGAGLRERCTVVPFDLTRPAAWPHYVPLHARHFVRAYDPWERRKAALLADAGYAVTVLEGDPGRRLSGTEVRRLLAEGRREAAAAGTGGVLAELLACRPMGERG
jgi:nicotinamide mononucleotide adenylyltransferase